MTASLGSAKSESLSAAPLSVRSIEQHLLFSAFKPHMWRKSCLRPSGLVASGDWQRKATGPDRQGLKDGSADWQRCMHPRPYQRNMRTKEGHGALAPAGGLFDSCSL